MKTKADKWFPYALVELVVSCVALTYAIDSGRSILYGFSALTFGLFLFITLVETGRAA